VVGARALITSGWGGENAIDVYQLYDDRAPEFHQTIRARSWWGQRRVAPGRHAVPVERYWGVQSVPLQ
jgi:hypothetical protein